MTATDQALTYLLSPARSGIDPELFVPLLRLLAEGEPVTVAELATASGRSEDTVRQGLAAVPDTEYDDQGRIGLFIDEGVGHVARSGGASVWG